jgi:MarR family transcriptional regulator, lower aerobic nicotinate degradation pathway regulator
MIILKMKNSSVIPLLEKWESFNDGYPGGDLFAFARWILAGRLEEKRKSGPPGKQDMNNAATAAILITRLQRYLGLYIRPVAKELGFTKEHEYNFLYQVSKMNKPNKNDLSKENMVEFSTGRDIIRRLIEKNLVQEKRDPEDKRAAQLVITPKGKKILERSFEMLAEPLTDYLGDLSNKEQKQLIGLLNKLNKYHSLKNRREILAYL